MRAAIYCSQMLPMGGSERVVLDAIEALVRLGWDVDLYVETNFNPSDLVAGFGSPASLRCRVHVRKLPPGFRYPRAASSRIHLDWAWSLLEKRVGECDVFIDTVPFINSHFSPYLRIPDAVYWNLLPSDLSWMTNERNILKRLYLVPLRVLARSCAQRWRRIQVHIANSEYTAKGIVERLSVDLHPIVIYPPVDLERWHARSGSNARSGVVTLARFEKWKRHDLQLAVARKLKAPFRMIGRALRDDEVTLLSHLRAAAVNTPVEFHVNVSQEQARRILTTSKVFLHTADAEPFGISTVEAIAAGCIPIVRNNGGTPEIVPFRELRFDTIIEAEEKIRAALEGEYDYLAHQLQDHIRRFDRKEFQKRFADCLLTASSSQ